MFYAGLVLMHTGRKRRTGRGGGGGADSNFQAQNNSHLKMTAVTLGRSGSGIREEGGRAVHKCVLFVLLRTDTIGPHMCQSEHN